MKKYTWTGAQGNLFELEAECTMELENVTLNSDGWEIPTNEKKVCTSANLVARIDGKKVESSWNINFWRIIDTEMDGVKRIWGIEKIGFTEERAEEINSFLQEVIESGKSQEVKDFEESEATAKREEELTEAKAIIEKAESQESIPTREEAKIWRKNYNDLHNEGGYGYVPQIVNMDMYQSALNTIKKLERR